MRLLMVATSFRGPATLGHPSGVWLEELAVPYYAFLQAGHEMLLASPLGGEVPVDPRAYECTTETPEEVNRFIVDPLARDLIGGSARLADIDPGQFAAVFLPGGYGAMHDLPDSLALGKVLAACLQAKRPVAAVGHGVAGLISTRNASDHCVIAGRTLTCFSNAEEAALGMSEYVPFLLETRLRKTGAMVETGPEFAAFMRHDGMLITGQNPASTKMVTDAVISALG